MRVRVNELPVAIHTSIHLHAHVLRDGAMKVHNEPIKLKEAKDTDVDGTFRLTKTYMYMYTHVLTLLTKKSSKISKLMNE